jgi:hypothetical protein
MSKKVMLLVASWKIERGRDYGKINLRKLTKSQISQTPIY